MTKPCLSGLVEPNKTEQVMGLESFGDIISHLKNTQNKRPFSLAMIKIRGETEVMMMSEKT